MKSQRSSFIAAIALGAFAIIGGTGLTVSSAWLITTASQHPPILVLSVAIVSVRFFGIFRSLARYGERVISHEAIFQRLTALRVQLFQAVVAHLQDHPLQIERTNKAIIDDVERAQEFHLRVTLPGLSALISAAFTVLLALWINPAMLIVVFLVLFVYAVVVPLGVKKNIDLQSREIEERENVFSESIANASHAMVEAEVFGYADQYRSELKSEIGRIQSLEQRSIRSLSVLQLIVTATLGAALVSTSYVVWRSSDLSPTGISISLFLIMVGFEGYINWFPNLFPAGKNRRAAKTVADIAAAKVRDRERTAKPNDSLLVARDLVPYWDEKFMAPITFTVAPGETLVIVGPSGVGKSTFASALLQLAPYEGSLTIGGEEVRAISAIHEQVVGTLQHGFIFNTSLRENLKIAGEDLSDGELLAAMEAVELAYIPLDEILGQFGRPLSGGEAKRLAIARTLLSPAPIVLLDEPLEHLDRDLASRIQVAISQWMKDRALIVITHTPWPQYSRKLELTRE